MCVTGILAAGAIGSSLIGARSASKAASAQERAAQAANDTQRYIFDRTVGLTEPAREIGQNALAGMASELGLGPAPFSEINPVWRYNQVQNPGRREVDFMVGDRRFQSRDEAEAFRDENQWQGFQASPGYQFRFDEGQRAVERAAAARGNRLSGATLQALQERGQNLASNEFGNWWNRLAGVAQGGQQSTNQQIQAGNTYGTNVSNNLLAMGNAQAQGAYGVNNALQGGINNMFGIIGMRQAGLI